MWLHPSGSGTGLRIELTGVAPEQDCRLAAVDTIGRREIAATWEATYSGEATYTARTAIPAGRLAALRVEMDNATPLVTLTLT